VAAQSASDESLYLRALAARVVAAYQERTRPAAVLLTGSAARGDSDAYSDLDLVMYYPARPDQAAAEAARTALGAERYRPLGPPEEGGFGEAFVLGGVEVQVGHATVASVESEMASVLERLEVGTPTQKALSGVLEGVPLRGAELIGRWQARLAAYPEPLARAMVERHLTFFPLWYLEGHLARRDATLWSYEVLVQSAQNILAVLAGLNRRYFSTFQFKRARAFVDRLEIAPPDLYPRLERLLAGGPSSVDDLERLVGETVALVARHMPEVDTRGLRLRLGERVRPWRVELR
jgi:hypothetical protein